MNWNWHRKNDQEVLSEKATAAESRLGAIKKAAKTFKKSVEDSLKTAPKNRNEDLSIRKRRTPEYMLGDQLACAVQGLNEERQQGGAGAQLQVSPLNTILERFANLEKTIGHMLAANEAEMYSFVVGSESAIGRLLTDDLPAVQQAKKDLERLVARRSHYQTSLEKEQKRLDKMAAEEEADHEALQAQREKKDRTSHDLEILTKEASLEQDKLTANLLTLVSRENRYAKSVFDLMCIKKQFYENAYKTIEAEIPNIQRLLEETCVRPVFGEHLEDHLRSTGREIAFPLALSVSYLMESGLTDEGLFRISAKQIKIDKFKAYVDAKLDLAELLVENDPHLHASVMKTYLRELPVPLLGGGETYDRWMAASRIGDESSRLKEYADIVNGEHSPAEAKNIKFVLKFLNEISRKSGENRMTPRNISIVLGPTLLWAAGRGSEAEHSNLESTIGVVVSLIESYHTIFGHESDQVQLEAVIEGDEEIADIRKSVLGLSEQSSVFSGSVCSAPSSPDGVNNGASHSTSPTTTAGGRPLSMQPVSSPHQLTVPGRMGGGGGGMFAGGQPDSQSPNQKRKTSIRGNMGKLMNSNPVGRNLMSKIGSSGGGNAASSTVHNVAAAGMAPIAYSSATRHSIQEEEEEGLSSNADE